MTLYKMELYKICHKKLFITGAVCVFLIILISFGMQLIDERATVDGITYTGYSAVQVNRQITEEFKGVLTDEKVERIVEKYGFPHKLEWGWGYFRDANFLNQFVLDYLSNGYIRDWNDFKIATKSCRIAESDLGEVIKFTGKDIILEYYRGWEAFLEVLSIGMVMGSILILLSLSAVFAGEGQTKMLSLLFTAKKGKEGDIYAKIAAAFTVAFGVFLAVFLLDLVLCGVVYGFDGLNCYNGIVIYYPWPLKGYVIPMYYYVPLAVLLSLFGQVSLCAITICVSAYCKSSFHALSASAAAWGAPFLIMMFAGGFYGAAKFLAAAPVFMVIYRIIEDIYNIWFMLIGIAIGVTLLCTRTACRRYNRQQ